MNECIIRRANENDIAKIMAFINDHWKKDHILAVSKDFFIYQHVWKDEVCYIIAETCNSNEIEGVLGYITYSQDQPRDLFGAIWKVRSNSYPMLGMKMQLYALKNLDARTFSAIALNPSTLSMHARWGAYMGELKQYYMLGAHDEYKIAEIHMQPNSTYENNIKQYTLRKVAVADDIIEVCEYEKQIGKIPIKSFEFVKHRYFDHPIYIYNNYAVIDDTAHIKGMLVTREVQYKERRVLRILDYLGDTEAISHLGQALQALLNENMYEYIDFYEYGLDDNLLKQAGFVLRKKNDINIIPNYFEPFVKDNIDIAFYTSEKSGNVILFKGDGDQDRPNFITKMNAREELSY